MSVRSVSLESKCIFAFDLITQRKVDYSVFGGANPSESAQVVRDHKGDHPGLWILVKMDHFRVVVQEVTKVAVVKFDYKGLKLLAAIWSSWVHQSPKYNSSIGVVNLHPAVSFSRQWFSDQVNDCEGSRYSVKRNLAWHVGRHESIRLGQMALEVRVNSISILESDHW